MYKQPEKQGFAQRITKPRPKMRLFDAAECELMVLACEASLRKDWKYNPKVLGLAHEYFKEYFERFNQQQAQDREPFSATLTEEVADAYLQSRNATRFFMNDLSRIASSVLEQRLNGGNIGITR
jgi:hypothetical protein